MFVITRKKVKNTESPILNPNGFPWKIPSLIIKHMTPHYIEESGRHSHQLHITRVQEFKIANAENQNTETKTLMNSTQRLNLGNISSPQTTFRSQTKPTICWKPQNLPRLTKASNLTNHSINEAKQKQIIQKNSFKSKIRNSHTKSPEAELNQKCANVPSFRPSSNLNLMKLGNNAA